MLAVAYPIAVGLPHVLGGRAGHFVAIVVAAGVGVAVYLGVQRLWGAPEVGQLRDGLRELRVRPAD
jgi:hypothetical protein